MYLILYSRFNMKLVKLVDGIYISLFHIIFLIINDYQIEEFIEELTGYV